MKIILTLAGLGVAGIAGSRGLDLALGAVIGWLAGVVLELRGRVRGIEQWAAQVAGAAGAPARAERPDTGTPDVVAASRESPVSRGWTPRDGGGRSASERADPWASFSGWLRRAKGSAGGADVDPGALLSLREAVIRFVTTGNVVAKAGMGVLFVGLAFLLKYSVEQALLPVELRLAAVAGAGLVALGWGWRIRERRPAFARVVQGGALGALYLCVFAAARLFELMPLEAAFVLMVGLVGLAGALALAQDTEVLALLGTGLGFLAPILASSGEGSHVMLFSYYLALNLGVLGLAWYRCWRLLSLTGFAFTFAISALWGWQAYLPRQFATTEPFLVSFFIAYVAIAVLQSLRAPPRLRGWVDATLVFGVPCAFFALQSALVQDMEYGAAGSAMAMALLYAGLARWLWGGPGSRLRPLAEAFAAVAVVSGTLSIPLAFDNGPSAALWAAEGAGLVWVALRQGRVLPALFGLLVQVGAGVMLIETIDAGATVRPVLNMTFAGGVLAALGGMVSGYGYHRARERISGWEQWIIPGALAWGVLWALGIAAVEIATHAAPFNWAHAMLMALAGVTTAVFLWGRRVRWPETAWACALLLPGMGIVFVETLASAQHAHPFARLGAFAWPLALAAQGLFLWQRALTRPAGILCHAHSLSAYVVMALGAWSGGYVLEELVASEHSWSVLGWGLVPAAMLGALLAWHREQVRGRFRHAWPLARHLDAYLGVGAYPVFAVLIGWVAIVSFGANDPAPVPWIPVLNPHSLAVLAVLGVLWRWAMALRFGLVPSGAGAPSRGVAYLLVLAFFGWANTEIARGVHHLAGVDWMPYDLLSSGLLQTAVSVLWALCALGLMRSAARSGRRVRWMVGAGLLGLTTAKLFLVELGDSGAATRIVSFVAVGLLMLLIGYLAPVPPKDAASQDPVLG